MAYTFSAALRQAYEALPIPVAYYQEIDGKAMALLVSDGLCKLMKADREHLIELLNSSLLDRVHPDDMGRLARSVTMFARRQCGYDLVYRGKYAPDEDWRYIHSMGSWQIMPDGTELAVFFYADISDSAGERGRLAESYALFQKDHFYNDPLTGLPNINFMREFADQKVELIRRQGLTPALVYFDVNGLRSYNSQYGYAEGDALLKLVTEAIQAGFEGALVTRGADDHFIVVAGMCDRAQLANRVRYVNEYVRARAEGNTRGVQAGICVYDADMTTPDAIDHAKHALKLIGNDLNLSHNFYSPEAEDHYWTQRYIIEAFDEALEKGWIRVYYQAIERLKTHKGCALEALARWADPERGMLSPGLFIPVLEKYHLLYRLDLYMVEQICKETATRAAAGLPLIPVSVNFSAQDFDHVSVADELDRILGQYGVSRDKLIVEITEQDIATGTEAFKAQLQALRARGYSLWLDDFGSGYSSLNVFSQFEVDLVKFDLELLRNLDAQRGANRYIMRTMVGLCRQLGIQTLAEGMEDAEQMAFLEQIGCELAQGFYYYKPQPLAETLARLSSGDAPIACETPEERRSFLEACRDGAEIARDPM